MAQEIQNLASRVGELVDGRCFFRVEPRRPAASFALKVEASYFLVIVQWLAHSQRDASAIRFKLQLIIDIFPLPQILFDLLLIFH